MKLLTVAALMSKAALWREESRGAHHRLDRPETKDSYLVVMDTVIEDMPDEMFHDRPWRKGNSPKSAVHAFLATNRRFSIDKDMESKLLLTVAPDGYLKCTGDQQ